MEVFLEPSEQKENRRLRNTWRREMEAEKMQQLDVDGNNWER